MLALLVWNVVTDITRGSGRGEDVDAPTSFGYWRSDGLGPPELKRMTPTRFVYEKPPIVEAICAINFPPSVDWNLRSPGELYSRLEHLYGGKPVQDITAQVEMVPTEAGAPGFVFKHGEPTTRLADVTGTRTVAFGQGVLLIQSAEPYEGWESFRQRIDEALSAYLEVAKPESVTRVGVRYVNHIRFESNEVSLKRYFTAPPDVPDELNLSMHGFASRIESIWPDGITVIIQNMQSMTTEDDRAAVVLDIDALRNFDDDNLDPGDCLTAVDDLRRIERQVFEALITDDARRMFNGD